MRIIAAWAAIMLALLVSCRHQGPWQYSQIQSGSPVFSSARLTYLADDIVNGIDLEFIALEHSNNLYLMIHQHPLKPYNGDEKKVLVKLEADGQKKFFLASLHKGGHRALLDESAKSFIIKNLLDNHPVTITTSGYKSEISPWYFDRKYPLLQTPPRFKSPIYSPLT